MHARLEVGQYFSADFGGARAHVHLIGVAQEKEQKVSVGEIYVGSCLKIRPYARMH